MLSESDAKDAYIKALEQEVRNLIAYVAKLNMQLADAHNMFPYQDSRYWTFTNHNVEPKPRKRRYGTKLDK